MLGFFSGGWRMVNEMEMDDDFWHFVSWFGGEDAVRNIRHEMTQEVREEMEDIEEDIREEWEDDIKDDIEEAMDEAGKDVREAILEEFAADIPEENEDTGIEADKVKKLISFTMRQPPLKKPSTQIVPPIKINTAEAIKHIFPNFFISLLPSFHAAAFYKG